MTFQVNKQTLHTSKTLFIGLTYFYGLGKTTGRTLQKRLGLSTNFKPFMFDLSTSIPSLIPLNKNKKGNIVTFNDFKGLINNKMVDDSNDIQVNKNDI